MAAGLARFQCHAVADFEVLDLAADLYDRTARLMAQNERRLDHIMTDRTGFIIVHITAADADIFELYQHFIVFRGGNIACRVAHFADAVHNGDFHFACHKNPSADVMCIYFYKLFMNVTIN